MSTTKNVAISAVIAAAIAIALVSAAILSPGLLGSKSSGSGTTAQSGSTGTLAVLLTDPPTVPNGVTAVYATYNNFAVHVSDAGNQSGWYPLNVSGQINLMSIVNVSQTVATSNLPSGLYNALRFNITSATVTYNGANYTALMVENPTGTRILTVPIVGGVEVNKTSTSNAVVDLTPTVLLLGNSTNPTFAFVGAARAYTLPSKSVPISDLIVGQRVNLNTISTYMQHTTHFQITSATLSPSSLSITVVNTGSSSIVFRLAAVSATTSRTGGFQPLYGTSALFSVEPNQSLVSLGGNRLQIVKTVAAAGFLVAPGASATFTYSGPLTLGPLSVQFAAVSPTAAAGTTGNTTVVPPPLQTPQAPLTTTITSGQKYVISIQGDGFIAQTSVIAGGSS
jgi:Domain of unknown function (DUF4382)